MPQPLKPSTVINEVHGMNNLYGKFIGHGFSWDRKERIKIKAAFVALAILCP